MLLNGFSLGWRLVIAPDWLVNGAAGDTASAEAGVALGVEVHQ